MMAIVGNIVTLWNRRNWERSRALERLQQQMGHRVGFEKIRQRHGQGYFRERLSTVTFTGAALNNEFYLFWLMYNTKATQNPKTHERSRCPAVTAAPSQCVGTMWKLATCHRAGCSCSQPKIKKAEEPCNGAKYISNASPSQSASVRKAQVFIIKWMMAEFQGPGIVQACCHSVTADWDSLE